ncbi:MAG: thioester reductase domain-containing protein [Marinagarivorans sp.]|nr:thioester reductase domain-containing protein [Marinagarivorans sp.]
MNAWRPYQTTTLVATYAKLLTNTPVTIGQPLPGRSVAVVNSAGELIPRGEAGELIILGQGIGLGYHQLPALSAQSFAPLKTLRNAKFSQAYRTGDRVNMDDNGDLTYLGRLDDEVKISGYRINPLEIEAALLSLNGVNQAAIVVVKNATQIILHAFIAADEKNKLLQVREQLRQRLPAPMLPAQYHLLAKLPINHNGKVDKKQLQQTINTGEPQQNSTQQSSPIKLTATEQKIASVWQKVLGVGVITADDDFFILGGQSLQTLQVASRLAAHFEQKINVTILFKYPTLKQLAQILDGDNTQPILNVKSQAQKDSHIHQPVFNPSTLNNTKNQGAIKTVLLTGANGFVGVHLLQQLSRRGVTVVCLIRATSPSHAEQRLRAAFKAQHLNYSAIAAQVHILIGDVAKPQLGLMPEHYAALINECDAIIHNAATTSVMRDYQSLAAANVTATQECFSLAATAKIPMHLISTIAVAPATGLPEDFVPWHSGLKDGYQQSKWTAENCMANAHALGYPVSIYRLGRITGSLSSGFINEQDLAWRMIRASTITGQFPNIALAEPWSPVDQIAQFVALQVLNNQHFGVYNPVPKHRVVLSQIFAWLQAAGLPLTPAAMPQWLMQLQNNADEGCQALAGFFEQRRQAGEELFLPLITTTKTQQALKECDVNFQPLTQRQFKRFLDYAIEHQIIEVNELDVV